MWCLYNLICDRLMWRICILSWAHAQCTYICVAHELSMSIWLMHADILQNYESGPNFKVFNGFSHKQVTNPERLWCCQNIITENLMLGHLYLLRVLCKARRKHLGSPFLLYFTTKHLNNNAADCQKNDSVSSSISFSKKVSQCTLTKQLHGQNVHSPSSSEKRVPEWQMDSNVPLPFFSRDGILERQFDKRLECFAPCYLHSLLRRKNEGGKLEPEKTRVYTQNPRLKMPFKNSISGKTQQYTWWDCPKWSCVRLCDLQSIYVCCPSGSSKGWKYDDIQIGILCPDFKYCIFKYNYHLGK